ncbi:MAG: sorbosone dehydrogenase family protein [Bacteroidales bacterium]|nr:sorbosone dehydrogenase family protein [Bacteroidales bacterium]
MIKKITSLIWLFPLLVIGQGEMKPGENLSKIMLPKGYKIEIYSAEVPSARAMDFAEDSTLFVGSMTAGKVYAIRPDRSVVVIDEGLDMPTGLDYYDGDLYVAAISRILKYENILETLNSSPEPVVINGNFPEDRWHGWKFIRIGPDGKMYIPVGAPCNVCLPDSMWYARIFKMTLDGKSLEYFAEGVRNTVGFDWNPAAGSFWFTDNGRDEMGDDLPPDELNKARVAGQHFGFPYIHGKNVMDPEFWSKRPKSAGFTNAVLELPAHAAALGMRFYTGEMFDEKYRGGVFIAEHGSWNRSKKIGYRVSYVRVEDDRATGYEVFAGGWLQGETPWGRPADVQVGPDGSLFVSDDMAGCIYRIYKN